MSCSRFRESTMRLLFTLSVDPMVDELVPNETKRRSKEWVVT